jgi:outer membrane protein OmpA-like peptidoglycan-associated protein
VPPVYQLPLLASPQQLAVDLGRAFPDTVVLPVGTASCPRGNVQVVRMVLPEPVLFASASDRPAAAGGQVLDFIAAGIHRDMPDAEITVLGHTDAEGSDAYNIDLSKRRAQTVLRGLVDRQFPVQQLSIVAIGKRQPVADNATPEGRARNRRVEFLVSPCLAANLEAVGRVRVATSAPRSAEVVRLTPAGTGSYDLKSVATVSLTPVGPAVTEVKLPVAEDQPSRPQPSPPLAQPTPSPAYTPKTLTPEAEKSPLGPAISY